MFLEVQVFQKICREMLNFKSYISAEFNCILVISMIMDLNSGDCEPIAF